MRDAQLGLGEGEDVVPQPRLEVALHLRQVVVRALPVVDQLLGEVKEVQPEVDQRAYAGLPSTSTCALVEMPAPRPHRPRRPAARRCAAVFPAVDFGGKPAARGVPKVEQGIDDVAPLGQLASSRSASHTFAPELRALMAIFAGVAGPVISTRRSCNAGGASATCHSDSRMCRVSGRKSSWPSWAASARRIGRAASSSSRRLANRVVELLQELQRGWTEDLVGTVHRMRVSQLERHRFLPECGC